MMYDQNKPATSLPNSSIANSILEVDLSTAVKQDALERLQIIESENGFFVAIVLKWDLSKIWYLTTRRERDTPRIFKDLNRLYMHLREGLPEVDRYEIFSNKQLPKKENTQTKTTIK